MMEGVEPFACSRCFVLCLGNYLLGTLSEIELVGIRTSDDSFDSSEADRENEFKFKKEKGK